MDVESLIEAKTASAGQLRGPYPVPEWAPHVPEIWSRKFTIERRKSVQRWISDDDPEGWVEIIYRFALDAEGGRIFKNRGHRQWLATAEESNVVTRIAAWIMGVGEGPQTVEEHEGN